MNELDLAKPNNLDKICPIHKLIVFLVNTRTPRKPCEALIIGPVASFFNKNRFSDVEYRILDLIKNWFLNPSNKNQFLQFQTEDDLSDYIRKFTKDGTNNIDPKYQKYFKAIGFKNVSDKNDILKQMKKILFGSKSSVSENELKVQYGAFLNIINSEINRRNKGIKDNYMDDSILNDVKAIEMKKEFERISIADKFGEKQKRFSINGDEYVIEPRKVMDDNILNDAKAIERKKKFEGEYVIKPRKIMDDSAIEMKKKFEGKSDAEILYQFRKDVNRAERFFDLEDIFLYYTSGRGCDMMNGFLAGDLSFVKDVKLGWGHSSKITPMQLVEIIKDVAEAKKFFDVINEDTILYRGMGVAKLFRFCNLEEFDSVNQTAENEKKIDNALNEFNDAKKKIRLAKDGLKEDEIAELEGINYLDNLGAAEVSKNNARRRLIDVGISNGEIAELENNFADKTYLYNLEEACDKAKKELERINATEKEYNKAKAKFKNPKELTELERNFTNAAYIANLTAEYDEADGESDKAIARYNEAEEKKELYKNKMRFIEAKKEYIEAEKEYNEATARLEEAEEKKELYKNKMRFIKAKKKYNDKNDTKSKKKLESAKNKLELENGQIAELENNFMNTTYIENLEKQCKEAETEYDVADNKSDDAIDGLDDAKKKLKSAKKKLENDQIAELENNFMNTTYIENLEKKCKEAETEYDEADDESDKAIARYNEAKRKKKLYDTKKRYTEALENLRKTERERDLYDNKISFIMKIRFINAKYRISKLRNSLLNERTTFLNQNIINRYQLLSSEEMIERALNEIKNTAENFLKDKIQDFIKKYCGINIKENVVSGRQYTFKEKVCYKHKGLISLSVSQTVAEGHAERNSHFSVVLTVKVKRGTACGKNFYKALGEDDKNKEFVLKQGTVIKLNKITFYTDRKILYVYGEVI